MALNKAYLQSGRSKASDEVLTPRYVVEPIVKYLKSKGYKKYGVRLTRKIVFM